MKEEASTLYCEPRLTKYLDLVIDIQASMIKRLTEIFDNGNYYFPPMDY